jgi:hypothetical protein
VSGRVGVEIGPARLRAVLVGRWRGAVSRTIELAWDPARPADSIAALRAALGEIDSVALSVGLGLLHVKRVELPPAADETRERMIALEAERFFAAREPVVVALAPGGDVGFAVEAARLETWCSSFESWAPVVNVEPAPIAAARVIGPGSSGRYALAAGEKERGVMTLERGALTSVRRIPDSVPDDGGSEIPISRGVDGTFASALGVLDGEDHAGTARTLASAERRAAFRRRRYLRTFTASAAAAAALLFSAIAFDRQRERTLASLIAEGQRLEQEAAPALEAQRRAASFELELANVRAIAPKRPDALAALAAVGAALPPDAIVLSLRVAGDEWQIDGTTRDAAALIPRLDKDGRFENVRSLSATSRFRDANRTVETFSIAFRVRPTT